VISGRIDGGSSILGAVVGAFDTGRVDMSKWSTTAEKCRDTANAAARLAEAAPGSRASFFGCRYPFTARRRSNQTMHL
jgi:hypothetical protein